MKNDSSLRLARQEVAKKNSWEERANEVYEILRPYFKEDSAYATEIFKKGLIHYA